MRVFHVKRLNWLTIKISWTSTLSHRVVLSFVYYLFLWSRRRWFLYKRILFLFYSAKPMTWSIITLASFRFCYATWLHMVKKQLHKIFIKWISLWNSISLSYLYLFMQTFQLNIIIFASRFYRCKSLWLNSEFNFALSLFACGTALPISVWNEDWTGFCCCF